MEPQHRSHEERAQIASALSQMDLTEELLRDAARHGFDESSDTTTNDVKTLSGTLAWAKTIRYLRDHLGPQGWTSGQHPDLETVIHPSGKFQIAVAAGNAATGTERMPATQEDKGPMTGRAVGRNRQLSFPREVHPEFGEPPEPEIKTWYLLFHFAVNDEGEGEIRAELSLPNHFSGTTPGVSKQKRGYIDQFHPRRKLEPIQIGVQSGSEGEAVEDEIEIEIERRG